MKHKHINVAIISLASLLSSRSTIAIFEQIAMIK